MKKRMMPNGQIFEIMNAKEFKKFVKDVKQDNDWGDGIYADKDQSLNIKYKDGREVCANEGTPLKEIKISDIEAGIFIGTETYCVYNSKITHNTHYDDYNATYDDKLYDDEEYVDIDDKLYDYEEYVAVKNVSEEIKAMLFIAEDTKNGSIEIYESNQELEALQYRFGFKFTKFNPELSPEEKEKALEIFEECLWTDREIPEDNTEGYWNVNLQLSNTDSVTIASSNEDVEGMSLYALYKKDIALLGLVDDIRNVSSEFFMDDLIDEAQELVHNHIQAAKEAYAEDYKEAHPDKTTFTVQISETMRQSYQIEASSEEEAIKIAQEGYEREELGPTIETNRPFAAFEIVHDRTPEKKPSQEQENFAENKTQKDIYEKMYAREIAGVEVAMENTQDSEGGALRLEAVDEKLKAQYAQEIISAARVEIPRGMDFNLPNADLNGVQETVVSSVSDADREVKDLQSDATAKEAEAGKLSKLTAISTAKEIMGRATIVTGTIDGGMYRGEIIAKTDIYAIQRITDNRAILHEIKDLSDETNIEVGAKIALHKQHDKTITVKEDSQEEELEEEDERGAR